jgi:hypothetical protein
MKNLYQMVVDAVTALNDGFSAHNVTEWVRQMAVLADQNGEDLDLPLSDDPAYKWYVSHADVKRLMEQLYSARTVDRAFGSGYFVYSLLATTPASVPPLVLPTTAPATAPVAQVPCEARLVNKLLCYVTNYKTKVGFAPTAKEVQSRFKRESYMTCNEFLNFAAQNNIHVTLGSTASVSTIG